MASTPDRRWCLALSITFAFVATHNHFVLDHGGKVFKQSAPVIKLPASATVEDHLRLLGVLNSSVACFWLKQNSHNKGNGGIGGGSATRTGSHDTSSPAPPSKTFRCPPPHRWSAPSCWMTSRKHNNSRPLWRSPRGRRPPTPCWKRRGRSSPGFAG
ncbi:DNA methylase domain protein [Mycobacterium xenopi 3993]|nr:DNA methylase domain protein [Mycobacterium xenopi 3993]